MAKKEVKHPGPSALSLSCLLVVVQIMVMGKSQSRSPKVSQVNTAPFRKEACFWISCYTCIKTRIKHLMGLFSPWLLFNGDFLESSPHWQPLRTSRKTATLFWCSWLSLFAVQWGLSWKSSITKYQNANCCNTEMRSTAVTCIHVPHTWPHFHFKLLWASLMLAPLQFYNGEIRLPLSRSFVVCDNLTRNGSSVTIVRHPEIPIIQLWPCTVQPASLWNPSKRTQAIKEVSNGSRTWTKTCWYAHTVSRYHSNVKGMPMHVGLARNSSPKRSHGTSSLLVYLSLLLLLLLYNCQGHPNSTLY